MSKTIFITGASSGLGKATARIFHAKGWNVIATMRNPEKETELTKLENIAVYPLDVTEPEQIKSTVKKVISAHDIDVVFNNAGYGLMGALEGFTDEQIVRQINTNLLGTIRVTQAFIPYFKNKKRGLFLSTTSIGGLVGFPLSSIYQATKFGLEGWSDSLSYELGRFGIQIRTFAPGAIATDFSSRSLEDKSHPDYTSIENKMQQLTADMMAQAATPDQMAALVYNIVLDEKDQVHYLGGKDAEAMYSRYTEIGKEAFRKKLGQAFL